MNDPTITDQAHYELERSMAHGYYRDRRSFPADATIVLLRMCITCHEHALTRYGRLLHTIDAPPLDYPRLIDRELAWLHVARELLAHGEATQAFEGVHQLPAVIQSAAACASQAPAIRQSRSHLADGVSTIA